MEQRVDDEVNDGMRSHVADVEPDLWTTGMEDVLGREFPSDEAAEAFYC